MRPRWHPAHQIHGSIKCMWIYFEQCPTSVRRHASESWRHGNRFRCTVDKQMRQSYRSTVRQTSRWHYNRLSRRTFFYFALKTCVYSRYTHILFEFLYLFIKIVDTEARYNDHSDPIVFGNIKSFIESINDPTKIQSILDIPLAQTALPKYLRQVMIWLSLLYLPNTYSEVTSITAFFMAGMKRHTVLR